MKIAKFNSQENEFLYTISLSEAAIFGTPLNYLCFCYYDRYFCVHSAHEEKSSSPLSMTYNLTKFPCISNNKSCSLGGFFRGFFPDTTKYMGVTHSGKEDLD